MRKQLSIAVLFPVDVRAMISNLKTPPAAVRLSGISNSVTSGSACEAS
jgi:hypothetical protein